jgi:acetylornithine deacetylase/succinyl-diaminopimelate desuccinylase-like protein
VNEASIDPIAFLEAAVGTPSHESVDAMRDLLVETLADAGHGPGVDEAGNVIASRGPTPEDAASPTIDGPHYVLNTHVDTVAPHVAFRRDGGTIHGRGACDAKGPLAAMLAAFDRVEPGSGRLTLAITPDEETDSTGAASLVADETDSAGAASQCAPFRTPPDGVIVGEPTGLDVCNAARGRFEGSVVLRGESAHAAEPEAGRNAITAGASILGAMATFDDAVGTPSHEVLGEPLLTPTRIEGGDAANQVPATCRITFDRRSVPPETSEGFRRALSDHLQRAVPDRIECTVSLVERPAPYLEAFETRADEPLVRALSGAVGDDVAVRPFGAATEASLFAAHAPTVVFGPGVLADGEGPVAHADREYVRIADVERAGESLQAALESLFSGGDP